MEDASKEFQIFLSPTRDIPQTHREKPTTKHRIVPVINKILSTSSSTFTLNQRKSSVYKAVSGVSFQDTDVSGKKSKKEKRDKKKERRQSYASYIADNDKKQGVVLPSGARRSRSLTSMESGMSLGSTDLSKDVAEITHPFAPTAIYNNSSGRRSRYTKVKEKRRSSSHARNGLELKKQENPSNDNEQQQPIRPRRARSASRSRKPLALISFSSENNLDIPKPATDDLFNLRCETYVKKDKKKDNENTLETKSHYENLSQNKQRTSESSGDIDFTVNDTDWRKYDALVTEKLDTLLKKKEEPEGGYFSLEREEQDEIERISENGDQFQRDNCSETIYVAQVFANDSKDKNNLPKYEQYMVEEIYSEVPFSNQGQEVGFVDDEGLYEEIFFDRSNEKTTTSYNNDSYGNTSAVNILVSPNAEPIHNTSKTLVAVERPKIEKSSSTTIVYISGDNHKHKNSTFYAPTPISPPHLLKQSASCSNLIVNSDLKLNNKSKKLSLVDISNDPPTFQEKTQANSAAWCGCYPRPNSIENHTLACINSRQELKSTKSTGIEDAREEHSSAMKIQAGNETHFPSRTTNVLSVPPLDQNPQSHPQCDEIPEPDYELSDIDLDMFAPKHLNSHRPQNPAQKHKLGSVPDMHLNPPPLQVLNFLPPKRNSKKDTKEITSPQTFRGFLEDSLFNPPDTESLIDDTEDLVLEDNQVVTCITDTSSSDESSTEGEGDSTAELKSPWLEAKNEFEFVAFKEGKSKASKFVRRKKPRKMISIPKIFGSPHVSVRTNLLGNPLNSTHVNSGYTDSREAPQRPTRRRRREETGQLETTN